MFSTGDRLLVVLVGAAALAAMVGLSCAQVEIEGGSGQSRRLRPRTDAHESPITECERRGLTWVGSALAAEGGYCTQWQPPRPVLELHLDAGAEVR